jgi:hypothetical protein
MFSLQTERHELLCERREKRGVSEQMKTTACYLQTVSANVLLVLELNRTARKELNR